MASDFRPLKALGVRDQLARMRIAFPHFRSRVRRGVLVAEGEIRPTGRSVAYRVRIEYKVGEPPAVRVISPRLRPREDGRALPHVYPGERLCLYLPGAGEWTAEMSLARTLVPWVSEWLFFYETWHATGEWLGGGVEPSDRRLDHKDSKGVAGGHERD